MQESEQKMMKNLEQANNAVAEANARAQRAENQAKTLAGQFEEARRKTTPSDGPSGAIDVNMPLVQTRKEKGREDVNMPLAESRKGKEREATPQDPYDGGDESDPNEEEEVQSFSSVQFNNMDSFWRWKMCKTALCP